MSTLYLLLSMLIIFTTNTVDAEEVETTTIEIISISRSKEIMCSSTLSARMAKLCNSNRKIKIVDKRDTSILIEKLMSESLQEHVNKQRKYATERWRRIRRQIADECCNQPCTISNLMLYCPKGAPLYELNPELFTSSEE